MRRNRRGFVLYLALAVAALLFLFMSNLAFFSHGEISQLSHTEKFLRCELALRSVYQNLAAPLRTDPWDDRPFKEKAVTRTETWNGVEVQSLIEDAPGAERCADLWLFARCGEARRAAFHRVAVNRSLFTRMNSLNTVFFSFIEAERTAGVSGVGPLRERVGEALFARAAKADAKERVAASLQAGMPRAALAALGGAEGIVPEGAPAATSAGPDPGPDAESAPAAVTVRRTGPMPDGRFDPELIAAVAGNTSPPATSPAAPPPAPPAAQDPALDRRTTQLVTGVESKAQRLADYITELIREGKLNIGQLREGEIVGFLNHCARQGIDPREVHDLVRRNFDTDGGGKPRRKEGNEGHRGRGPDGKGPPGLRDDGPRREDDGPPGKTGGGISGSGSEGRRMEDRPDR